MTKQSISAQEMATFDAAYKQKLIRLILAWRPDKRYQSLYNIRAYIVDNVEDKAELRMKLAFLQDSGLIDDEEAEFFVRQIFESLRGFRDERAFLALEKAIMFRTKIDI